MGEKSKGLVDKLAGGLLDLILPLLQPIFEKILVEFVFEKFFEANEEAYKTALTSIYPAIDVQLENLAASTGTKIDDTVVAILKTSIETSAGNHGFRDQLPNLDAD